MVISPYDAITCIMSSSIFGKGRGTHFFFWVLDGGGFTSNRNYARFGTLRGSKVKIKNVWHAIIRDVSHLMAPMSTIIIFFSSSSYGRGRV